MSAGSPPWAARRVARAWRRARRVDTPTWLRRRRASRARRLSERYGAQGPGTANMTAALEAVLRGLHRQPGGLWCEREGHATASAVQYALVDVVGCGMVDVVEERVVMQRPGWLALAVARPDIIG